MPKAVALSAEPPLELGVSPDHIGRCAVTRPLPGPRYGLFPNKISLYLSLSQALSLSVRLSLKMPVPITGLRQGNPVMDIVSGNNVHN